MELILHSNWVQFEWPIKMSGFSSSRSSSIFCILHWIPKYICYFVVSVRGILLITYEHRWESGWANKYRTDRIVIRRLEFNNCLNHEFSCLLGGWMSSAVNKRIILTKPSTKELLQYIKWHWDFSFLWVIRWSAYLKVYQDFSFSCTKRSFVSFEYEMVELVVLLFIGHPSVFVKSETLLGLANSAVYIIQSAVARPRRNLQFVGHNRKCQGQCATLSWSPPLRPQPKFYNFILSSVYLLLVVFCFRFRWRFVFISKLVKCQYIRNPSIYCE